MTKWEILFVLVFVALAAWMLFGRMIPGRWMADGRKINQNHPVQKPARRKPQYRHRCHSCGEIFVSDEDNAVCPVCGEKF